MQYLLMAGTAVSLFAVLIISTAVFRAQVSLAGYGLNEQAYGRNNPAVLVRKCGFIGAIFVAIAGSYHQLGLSVFNDATNFIATFVGALIALTVSQYANDHFILSNVRNNDEVVGKQNSAVAIVEFSTYLATALIFIGGMHDPSHDWWYNIVWFLIGQAILITAAQLYALRAPLILKKIAEKNTACALSLAGFVLAAGIVVGAVIHKPFTSWSADLFGVALAFLIWLALMAGTRLSVDRFLFGGHLSAELADDGNWAAGLFDGMMFVVITTAFVSVHAYS